MLSLFDAHFWTYSIKSSSVVTELQCYLLDFIMTSQNEETINISSIRFRFESSTGCFNETEMFIAEKHNIATDILSFGQLERRNSSERERHWCLDQQNGKHIWIVGIDTLLGLDESMTDVGIICIIWWLFSLRNKNRRPWERDRPWSTCWTY